MSLLPYQSTRLALQSLAVHSRSLPLLASRDLPPFFHQDTPHHYPGGNPKGKKPLRDGVEEEVSDREWELRVGEWSHGCVPLCGIGNSSVLRCLGSGLLHLRATLPYIFNPPADGSLFPPSVYSNQVCLRLPAPLPVKVRMLAAMAFAIRSRRVTSFRPCRCTSSCSQWLDTECMVSHDDSQPFQPNTSKLSFGSSDTHGSVRDSRQDGGIAQPYGSHAVVQGSCQAFSIPREQAQASTSPSTNVDLWHAEIDTRSCALSPSNCHFTALTDFLPAHILADQLTIHLFARIRPHPRARSRNDSPTTGGGCRRMAFPPTMGFPSDIQRPT
jgi:hypothetical protein